MAGNLDATMVIKTVTSGSYSYTDAGGEQTVLEVTDGVSRVYCGVWLDTNAFTKDGSLKVYYKVDGTNYRLATTVAVTAATPCVFLDSVFGIHYSFKLTWTESADEAAARTIYYDIVGI